MLKTVPALAASVALIATPLAASAQTNMSSSGQTHKDGTTKGASSGRRSQERATQEIPHCTRRIGTVAIVEPDNQWWRELNLGSPEAILKVFIQQSGCFTIVNRGRAMQSRAMERAMARSACSAAACHCSPWKAWWASTAASVVTSSAARPR